MKKFIAIPLLVLYLVAVSGMMVQLHFCGSKIASWNLNERKVSCCCQSDEKTEKDGLFSLKSKVNDCCKDKTITLKIAQDQNRTSNVQMQLQSLQLIPVAPPFISAVLRTFPQGQDSRCIRPMRRQADGKTFRYTNYIPVSLITVKSYL